MNETQSERIPLILIVDDDRTMRSLLNLAMEEEGYKVAEAENGEQCLSEYTHFQPDLILLDAVMPDIDGFTCCQKIRSLPGGDRLPILMITVLDDHESVEQAFNAGATDYITKPIHWSVLSERVRRLLDGDRSSAELTAVEEQLRQHQAWEKLTSNILEQLVSGDRSRDSIQQVLFSIQEWLQAARIVLYQSDSQTYLKSVATKYKSSKNFSEADFNLIAEYGEQYQQGKTIVIEDVSQADLPFALIQQLKQSDTQALSIVPIKKVDQTLGWLEIQFSGVIPQDRLLLNRLSDLGNLLAIVIS
ncbi:MAG: response regulator [Pleurocapsa sp. MO_192.B19]|nr:response regulator [Pleurocapsa sp. MO_192.B19]